VFRINYENDKIVFRLSKVLYCPKLRSSRSTYNMQSRKS